MSEGSAVCRKATVVGANQTHVTMYAHVLAVALLCVAASAQAERVVINSGGDYLVNIGFRGDTGKYCSAGSHVFSTETPVSGGSWKEVYKTHRWIDVGDLVCDIPVPNGKYKLALMFAEIYDQIAEDVRVFTVSVNGKSYTTINGNYIPDGLDVYKLSGGLYQPFYANLGIVEVVDESIKITLGRIEGKENPMLSGIVINGLDGIDAARYVQGEGIGKAEPEGSPSPDPTMSMAATVTPDPTVSPNGAGVFCDKYGKNGKMPGYAGYNDRFYMNVAGGSTEFADFGAENEDYVIAPADKGATYQTAHKLFVKSVWKEVFVGHRFAWGAPLTYRIPVPEGTYTVVTMHAESHFGAVGDRVFDIYINGVAKKTNVDVYATVGKNIPLYQAFEGVESVDGYITISFENVTENPFVNGIIIDGLGAHEHAVGGAPC